MRQVTPLVFIGQGNAGSFQIRGRQIASALGAPCFDARAGVDHVRASVAIIIKRAPVGLFQTLRASGTYCVWDAVDFWPQPDAMRTHDDLLDMLRRHIKVRQPDEVIVASKAMQDDVEAAVPGMPVTVIPHHADPRLHPHTPTNRGAIVGYVGRIDYMEAWRPAISAWCHDHGHVFMHAPDALQSADVLIGPRCGQWDTLASRRWKSNVKQANALAQGVPFVATPHEAYMEHALVETTRIAEGLDAFLDALGAACSRASRRDAFESCAYAFAGGFPLSLRRIADHYARLYGVQSCRA